MGPIKPFDQYRFLVETAQDAIFVKDLKSRYVFVNNKGQKFLGLPENKIYGRTDLELLDNKEEAKRNIKDDQAILEFREEHRFVNRIAGPVGKEYWFDVIKTPWIEAGKIVGLVGIARDITESKAFERRSHRRLEFEQTISRISSRFMTASDLDKAILESLRDMGRLSGASRCSVFLFNAQLTEANVAHQWCEEGVKGHAEFLHNLQAGRFRWWMSKLIKGERIHIKELSQLPREARAEKKILKAIGSKSILDLPIYIEGRLSGFIGFGNVEKAGEWRDEDISLLSISAEIIGNAYARRNASEKLQQSERRYHTLVENIDLGISLIDANHTIVMTNSGQARLFSKSPDEFVGKKCYWEFEKRKQVCAHCPGTKAMSTNMPASVETEGVRDDGSRFKVRIYAYPYQDAAGNNAGFIEVVEDIFEQKRIEEALKRSEDLLQAEKASLQAKNTALKEVLHQIEEEKNALKRSMVLNIDKIVKPILVRLRDRIDQDDREYLDLALKNLLELESPFIDQKSDRLSRLSPKEIEVCNMIREGYSSKDIALQLSLSLFTINRYREHIRKKLKLTSKSTNLARHLQSL